MAARCRTDSNLQRYDFNVYSQTMPELTTQERYQELVQAYGDPMEALFVMGMKDKFASSQTKLAALTALISLKHPKLTSVALDTGQADAKELTPWDEISDGSDEQEGE